MCHAGVFNEEVWLAFKYKAGDGYASISGGHTNWVTFEMLHTKVLLTTQKLTCLFCTSQNLFSLSDHSLVNQSENVEM